MPANAACPPTPTSLAPGASITCSGTYTVTQGDVDAGAVTNTAKRHASFGLTPVTSNADSVTINATQTKELTLDKTSPDTSYDHAGQVLHYSYLRSEERRVGKECRSRRSPYH